MKTTSDITELSRSGSYDSFGHGQEYDYDYDYDYDDALSISPRFGFYYPYESPLPHTSGAYAEAPVGRSFYEALLSVIDKRMKEHTDEVLHAVSSVNARLTRFESQMCRMENAMDDLKDSIAFYHGKTDRKLRELEHLLREVRDFTRDIRDKQDIAEVQIQITMLSMSAHPKKQETAARTEPFLEPASSVSQQPAQRHPIAYISTSHHFNPSPASQLPPPLMSALSPTPPPPEVYQQIPYVPHMQQTLVQPRHFSLRLYEHYQPPVMPAPPPPAPQVPSSSSVKHNPGWGSPPRLTHSSIHSEYPQLPTAKILPQALPTASITDPEPSEDVVDGVVAMGFRRDIVKATVNRLMHKGQPGNVNVILDLLMQERHNHQTTSNVRLR